MKYKEFMDVQLGFKELHEAIRISVCYEEETDEFSAKVFVMGIDYLGHKVKFGSRHTGKAEIFKARLQHWNDFANEYLEHGGWPEDYKQPDPYD